LERCDSQIGICLDSEDPNFYKEARKSLTEKGLFEKRYEETR
jgi:hypothetical protein